MKSSIPICFLFALIIGTLHVCNAQEKGTGGGEQSNQSGGSSSGKPTLLTRLAEFLRNTIPDIVGLNIGGEIADILLALDKFLGMIEPDI